MKSRSRFVQNIDRLAGSTLAQLRRQLDSLCLTAGQLGGRLSQSDIGKSYIVECRNLPVYGRHIFEEFHRLLDRHIEDIIDAFPFIFDLQRFPVIALAAADLTRHIDIRQEMHLDLDDTIATAGFTSSALDIEAESSLAVTLGLCVRRRSKQIADQIKYSGISSGVGSGSPSDGRLVNVDDFVQLFHTFDTLVSAGNAAGSSLSINASYTYSKPAVALPRIISGSVNKASIAAIKRYICSEYAAKFIASKTGIPFENLINGDYKLVIEPIAYFTHNGKNYAMTATEAALYNKLSGGALRRVLPSLTHQNLPLALFLEKSDLGYPAWTGSTSGKVSDDAIISSLGIGIVSYKDVPSEELEAPDYTYRVDTDVISSIMLTSATEVNPKNPAKATFYINGGTYTVSNIVMPSGETERSSIRGNSRTTVWTLRFCC